MSGFTNCDDKLYLNKNISLFCDVFFVTSVTFLAVVHVPIDSGKPLIEMCWFYMGIVLIALGLAYICQTGKCGKKVSQTILASPYTPPPLIGNAPDMETTHFKKGLPLRSSSSVKTARLGLTTARTPQCLTSRHQDQT